MALRLTDVHRALGLFAEGLAGHAVRIEAHEHDAVGWPWNLALPDPAVVELPPVASVSESDEDQRLVFRAQVLHQLALVEFGTFGEDRTNPDPRSLIEHPLVVDSPDAETTLAILTMLEHLRVVAASKRRYPGAAGDLDRALSLARASFSYESAGLASALHLRCIGAAADEIVSHLGPSRDSLARWLCGMTAKVERREADLDLSAEVAVAIAEHLVVAPTPQTYEGQPLVLLGEDPENLPNEEGEELEFEGLNLSTPPLDVEADRGSDDLQGAIQSTPLPSADEFEQLEASTRPRSVGNVSTFATDIGNEDRTYLYDEWNHLTAAYLPSWCRVVERRVEGDDHAFASEVRKRHSVLAAKIRRQFAMLRPEDRLRVYRRDDGEELDLDAAIEAIVDRRSAVAVDDRLAIRRDRISREVATALLVDLSASTSSPTVEPEPYVPSDEDDDEFVLNPYFSADDIAEPEPARRVIDVAKESVALMCDALEQLGDQHAVYGFSGNGRLDVEFRLGKEFDEQTSPSTWAALAGFEPIRYTRMGPAIRHAAAKLSEVQARTKLLLVISDGYPQDSDYGPNRGDKQYGVHDTAKAVEEASVAGIDTFCVTIDPAGHDYLKAMFAQNRYLVIDEVESLPDELAKLYLSVAGPAVRRIRARSADPR